MISTSLDRLNGKFKLTGKPARRFEFPFPLELDPGPEPDPACPPLPELPEAEPFVDAPVVPALFALVEELASPLPLELPLLLEEFLLPIGGVTAPEFDPVNEKICYIGYNMYISLKTLRKISCYKEFVS